MVVLQVLGTSAITWLRIGADLCEFSTISSSRVEEMSSGIEEMEAKLNAGECRIFAMHCENFVRIVKISQP